MNIKTKKEVGVLGMWISCNYGAVLTSFALYRLVEELGYAPTLIDHSGHPKMPARFKDKTTCFRRFIKDRGLETTEPIVTRENYEALNDRFSTFLVGSDQVWRYQYNRHMGLFYFLDFVAPQNKKIAFGSSFGIEECNAPLEVQHDASMLLKCFTALSSREKSGVDILARQYGVDAKFVLDPVFLCKMAEWEECIKASTRSVPANKYVLSYVLDPNPPKRWAIQHIATREGLALLNMVDAQTNFEAKKAKLGLDNVIAGLTVEDWLFYIYHCEHLVTDSFHGVCFAIIFNKPFTCIVNESRGSARFTSLLGLFGLESRMLRESDKPNYADSMPDIDWDSVNQIKKAHGIESKRFLQDALDAPKTPAQISLEEVIYRWSTLRHQFTWVQGVAQRLYANYEKQNQAVQKLSLLLSYKKLRRNYFRYKIMSALSFGRKRQKYQKKYKEARKLYKMAVEARNAVD